MVETWYNYNLKFLDLSVFACFRRKVFTLRILSEEERNCKVSLMDLATKELEERRDWGYESENEEEKIAIVYTSICLRTCSISCFGKEISCHNEMFVIMFTMCAGLA